VRTLKAAECPPLAREAGFVGSAGESGSLFAGKPVFRGGAAKSRRAPELTAARVLCNQLRRQRAGAQKKRIVHLICLNLLAVLKRRS
jgi:hypothetical protein